MRDQFLFQKLRMGGEGSKIGQGGGVENGQKSGRPSRLYEYMSLILYELNLHMLLYGLKVLSHKSAIFRPISTKYCVELQEAIIYRLYM